DEGPEKIAPSLSFTSCLPDQGLAEVIAAAAGTGGDDIHTTTPEGGSTRPVALHEKEPGQVGGQKAAIRGVGGQRLYQASLKETRRAASCSEAGRRAAPGDTRTDRPTAVDRSARTRILLHNHQQTPRARIASAS